MNYYIEYEDAGDFYRVVDEFGDQISAFDTEQEAIEYTDKLEDWNK